MKKTEHVYVGIDAHKKSWSVSIRTAELEHHTFHMKPEVEMLHNYLKKHFSGWRITCAYEASCVGYWIQKALTEKGYECLILNPADIPGTDKEEKRKSDLGDCRKIARELSKGEAKGIYVPSDEQIAFRNLFRKRNNLVKNLREIKSLIRAQLLFLGTIVPEQFDRNNWSREFKTWLKELKFQEHLNRLTLDSHLRKLEFLWAEFLSVERELRTYARKYYKEKYFRLLSVPGIGPVTSMSIIAEIGDLTRFKNTDQLCSYIGLVPNTYQSSDTKYDRGMTRRAKKMLRSYFIESAWTAMRRDPEMMLYYSERVKKMHPNKVIVKIARKLVNRLYYIMKHKKNYEINISEKKQEDDRKTATAEFL